jgi:hypothetical protein
MGGQAILCCEENKGRIQWETSWCVVYRALRWFQLTYLENIRLAKLEEVVTQTRPLT